MAYRKVDESSLTSLADAIRTKAGLTDELVFPAGFIEALGSISGGMQLPSWMTKIEFATVTISSSSATSISIPCTLGAKPTGFIIFGTAGDAPASQTRYWKYFIYPPSVGISKYIGGLQSSATNYANASSLDYETKATYSENTLKLTPSASGASYYTDVFAANQPYYCIMWI